MDYFSCLKQITSFVFDMDGVLTDGGLLVTETNQWLRRMHVRDGYALQFAVKKGYRVLVVSGSSSEPVRDRLGRLGVHDVFMGVKDKKTLLLNYVTDHQIPLEEVLFMGDDLPDLECMQAVGFPCCPADAVREILQTSRYISPLQGGAGCVRDVIEQVLRAQEQWYAATDIRST